MRIGVFADLCSRFCSLNAERPTVQKASSHGEDALAGGRLLLAESRGEGAAERKIRRDVFHFLASKRVEFWAELKLTGGPAERWYDGYGAAMGFIFPDRSHYESARHSNELRAPSASHSR
jgi:hypothetical protein